MGEKLTNTPSQGIWVGHSVQEIDGRTVIFAPTGERFHDFGRKVEREVYDEVIRAWRSGFEHGLNYGSHTARETVRNAVADALGLVRNPLQKAHP